MVYKGRVLTTHHWKAPVYKSDVITDNNPYGNVYRNLLEGLEERGWVIERAFNPNSLARVAGNERAEDDFIHRQSAALPRDVGMVIHDPYTFYHQLWHAIRDSGRLPDGNLHIATRKARAKVHEALYRAFGGRVERTWSHTKAWDDETSSKDRFFRFADSVGIPVPDTILLGETDESWLNYETLSDYLTGSPDGKIVLKKIESSGGKDIYPITSQKDFDQFRKAAGDMRGYVAQRSLQLPTGHPYSIRVVTWGDRILGAALLVNMNHPYCSNSKQGGLAFNLAVNGEKPRTGRRKLEGLDFQEIDAVNGIFDWCGINIDRRVLPEDLDLYANFIGDNSTNSLLRGHDFMYDDHRKPVAIESNYHPGPPGTGMFSDITGEDGKDFDKEVEIASRLILEAAA